MIKKILTPLIPILIAIIIFLIFFFAFKLLDKPKTINFMDETIKFEDNQETTTELKIETIQEGSGEGAENGNELSVHYSGYLEDGTKFDSSIDRGQPFSFTLGVGQVIQGWEKGMLGMKIGEKRKLTIPYTMAYGEAGIPGAIPAKATLIFEVELLGIK